MNDLDLVLSSLADSRMMDRMMLRDIGERESNGIFIRQETVSGVYNVTVQDGTVFCDTSGGVATINLPTAVGVGGRIYLVCDKGNAAANNVTVTPQGGETISGAGSYVISSNYGRVWLQSDGSDWYVIAT